MVRSFGSGGEEYPGTVTPADSIDVTYVDEGNYDPETSKDEFTSWEMTEEMVGWAVTTNTGDNATDTADEPALVLPPTNERNTVWITTSSSGYNWKVYHATDYSTGIANRWGSYTVAGQNRFIYDPDLDTWWVD